jgi:hypothetical protein
VGEDATMLAADQTDDVIQPRSHAVTEELPRHQPWLTISPDEQTVPQREPERLSHADLIRTMTESFRHGRSS